MAIFIMYDVKICISRPHFYSVEVQVKQMVHTIHCHRRFHYNIAFHPSIVLHLRGKLSSWHQPRELLLVNEVIENIKMHVLKFGSDVFYSIEISQYH